MKKTNFAFGAVTLLIVGLAVWWELGQLTSPGPLHPTHASLNELNGRNDCRTCHGDNTVTMNEACLICHVPIGDQITETFGLHGRLDSIDVLACQRCHVEHTDGVVPMVSEVSFELAGIDTPDQYRHEGIPEFALGGTHDRIQCASCHVAADQSKLSPGEFRFLGLSQSCTACHDDVHSGQFSMDCASCHGQTAPFKTVAAFEHTNEFLLVGSHAGLACLVCHEKGTPFSIENEQANSPQSVRSCAACHETSHTPDFLADVAGSLGPSPVRSSLETCSLCHNAMDSTFGFPSATVTREQHAFTAFPLVPPHDAQDCLLCHTTPGTIVAGPVRPEPASNGSLTTAPWVTLQRSADDCRVCHGDPHEGQFDRSTTNGVVQPSCLDCHDPLSFTPSNFDAARHAQTAFPLSTAHSDVACVQCHVSTPGMPTVFAGTPTTCAACHEDTHAGQFMAQLNNDCAICHTDARFSPSLFDDTMHAETRFPLDGGHAAVGCRICHEVENGTRQFVATPMACASCHEDVHDGAFGGPDLPKAVDGKLGCARCHTTDTFESVRWTDQTHEQWTGYALVGNHAEASCNDCHKPSTPEDTWVASFAKAPTDCASCHQDPHAGQFEQAGISDCARCHNAEQSFTQFSFDHQTDSDFKLDETHSVLLCMECHRPEPSAPIRIIRYRPIPHDCRDCHGFGVDGSS